jgi:DNA-binding transcriptional regulator YdaS (Cro superfamily)
MTVATDIRPLWLKLSDANRAALAALGLLKSQETPHSNKGNAMTPIKRAIDVLGGQTAAARTLGLSGYQVVQQWIAQCRVPAEYCPRIEILTGVRCEDLNDRVEWSLIRGTDQSAQLQRAIADTRIVFESVPAVSEALNYLMAVLHAVTLPAAPGGANASIAKETHIGAGAVPVAGAAAGLLDGLKGFVAEVNASAAASAAAWAAPAPSTIISTLEVKIDTSEIDAALAKVAELKLALASVLPVPGDRLVLS